MNMAYGMNYDNPWGAMGNSMGGGGMGRSMGSDQSMYGPGQRGIPGRMGGGFGGRGNPLSLGLRAYGNRMGGSMGMGQQPGAMGGMGQAGMGGLFGSGQADGIGRSNPAGGTPWQPDPGYGQNGQASGMGRDNVTGGQEMNPVAGQTGTVGSQGGIAQPTMGATPSPSADQYSAMVQGQAGNSAGVNAMSAQDPTRTAQMLQDQQYNNGQKFGSDTMDAYRKSIGYMGKVQPW